jgi:hypothetical protein
MEAEDTWGCEQWNIVNEFTVNFKVISFGDYIVVTSLREEEFLVFIKDEVS